MDVIGECLDKGDGSGTSALMDIYETLLVLVSQFLCYLMRRGLNAVPGNSVT